MNCSRKASEMEQDLNYVLLAKGKTGEEVGKTFYARKAS